uniref:Anaphase-promoting complex subunit 4-like WD40 domain-containing protein n=1 Tax=Arcella intermedia TaxID=1963864 RepID=A0A6B2L548_9EUKA|eukprot:TRINITY_DN1189_c0_g1_i1.p1 TRINITY_DN1189_c0_g1~~TRINITY_DN1189_c0_g1_i1.p1  ORF type:complete len:430 (-),score=100.69 TRINITY_DN1189_c0_g1_i1:148-1437(-)
MITSVGWINKGIYKEFPTRYEATQDFKEEIAPPKPKPSDPNDVFNMEHYDEEDDAPHFSSAVEGLMVYKNEDDPFILVPDRETAQDMEDFMIRKEDMILLCAVSEEDEVSHLDVYVYEEKESNTFIHHDYLLPAFPLSLAWLDFPVGGPTLSGERERTNYVAVGTFEPYIEIWDLDTVNQPAPLVLLGGPENAEDISRIDKNTKLVPGSHQEAVLGLSWNTYQRNLLASASADCTTKIWDLVNGKCLKTYTHADKVQCILWNPAEPSILASGGFGGVLTFTDVRANSATFTINMNTDIESLLWQPQPNHSQILIGTETGRVSCIDMLKPENSRALWNLEAHSKPTQALAISPAACGLLATGSTEKESPLKLWDISAQPKCLYSKTEDLGNVFSLKFAQDLPFILAIGSKSKKPVIMDTKDLQAIRDRYG